MFAQFRADTQVCPYIGQGLRMSLYDNLDRYVKESRPRFEEWLGRLVEIPTVSMDPARRDDMRRGAALAVEYLTMLSAQATIVETGGHPLVVGGWIGNPAWPTVAVYNHLGSIPALRLAAHRDGCRQP